MALSSSSICGCGEMRTANVSNSGASHLGQREDFFIQKVMCPGQDESKRF